MAFTRLRTNHLGRVGSAALYLRDVYKSSQKRSKETTYPVSKDSCDYLRFITHDARRDGVIEFDPSRIRLGVVPALPVFVAVEGREHPLGPVCQGAADKSRPR